MKKLVVDLDEVICYNNIVYKITMSFSENGSRTGSEF